MAVTMLNVKTDRMAIFYKLYKKSGNITQSAIAAGYSPKYADKQGKQILTAALKREQLALQGVRSDPMLSRPEKKQTLLEAIGMSREELMNEYRYVAEQKRDLTSKLKAMAPLLKAEGYDITNTEQVNQPILNISVDSVNLVKPNDTLILENQSVIPVDPSDDTVV